MKQSNNLSIKKIKKHILCKGKFLDIEGYRHAICEIIPLDFRCTVSLVDQETLTRRIVDYAETKLEYYRVEYWIEGMTEEVKKIRFYKGTKPKVESFTINPKQMEEDENL